MPKNDTIWEAPERVDAAPVIAEAPPPVPVPELLVAVPVELAAGEPLCPVCTSTLRAERRTPDFSTHHTTVCDRCGYRQKVKG